MAVKRLGDLDSVSREFAHECSERLWKQLVVSPGSGGPWPEANREAMVAVGAVLIGTRPVEALFPVLFGYRE